MKKLLTQEEIDALLANVSKAEPTQVDRALERMRLVQLYDFKHPERISKEQLRTLRTIHDNLARMLATYLSTTLRSLVDVNFSSIDQVTFNEYTMSLGVPNSLYIIDLKKLDGKAIIEISPQFLLYVVDRLLGGMGDTEVEVREVTIIEQSVVKRIVLQIVSLLNEVWEQVHEIGAELSGYESDPQFVQIARSSEALAIVFFEIRIRGATFTMNITLPYYALEPILAKLSAQSMMALAGRRPLVKGDIAIQERLRATRLPVRAIMAETSVRMKDFIDMKPDDLLQLDQKTTAHLPVLVGGKPKFLGSPGKLGRRSAVKVIRPISVEEVLIYE